MTVNRRETFLLALASAGATLPGGDFPMRGFAALVAEFQTRWPELSPSLLTRLARAYGTRTRDILGDARSLADPKCKDGEAVCTPASPTGPGDFSTSTGVASNPPTPASASIVVSPGDV
mgnify:CR=1 FL=1